MERLLAGNQEFNHYPFRAGEDPAQVHQVIQDLLHSLLADPFFDSIPRTEAFDFLYDHFSLSEALFLPYKHARMTLPPDDPTATLIYHDENHAVYQAEFDAAATFRKVLKSNPVLVKRKRLTPVGVIGAVYYAGKHDDGWPTATEVECCAARNDIHVQKGRQKAADTLLLRPIPAFIDREVERFLAYGDVEIYSTDFPYTKEKQSERLKLLAQFDPSDGVEADELSDIVRFSDFGGQLARIDQYPWLTKLLKVEKNYERPGLGTEILGDTDEQMDRNNDYFMEHIALPVLRPIGHRLFRTYNHAFAREWRAQGPIRRRIGPIHACKENIKLLLAA